MTEVWMPVSGYEDAYEVSNKGKVRSLDRQITTGRIKGKELTQTLLPCGYLEVSLWSGNKGKHKRVHRLVAAAFCEKKSGHDDVNHKDGNKLNNCADNLEWCTRSENMLHAYRMGLQTKGRYPIKKYGRADDGK